MPHDPLAWIDDELSRLAKVQLRRERIVRGGPQTSPAVIGGRNLVNFGANDYLALAADPRLTEAVVEAASRCGWGSGSSPLVTGRGQLHAQLEAELARFEGAEAALLFSTGFSANAGTIAALVGREDVVLSDAKNHASIVDGCRLSGSRVEVYRHTDVDHLRQLLEQAHGFRRRLIVTDGLFSMDGDLAPLDALADLAEQYGAMLMVDEAHATGVFGAEGRGVSEHLRAESGVHIRVGTLSKALGSVGGFVVGAQHLIDWLLHRARSYVFSTAMPEAACAAAIAALKIVREEPQRREQLLMRAKELRQRLRQRGWNLGTSQSQIIPVIIGDTALTVREASALLERGCYVPGIRPPAVPEGESLLRVSLCYFHDRAAVDLLVDTLQSRRTRSSQQ